MDNKAKKKRGVIKFVKSDIDYSMNGVTELSQLSKQKQQ